MADITMCSGEGCLKKESCYRFTAEANPYRQSYFANPPYEGAPAEQSKTVCDHYWPSEIIIRKEKEPRRRRRL